jgi:hypothetical protein
MLHWLHTLQDPFISDVLHTAMNVYKDGLRLYGPDRLFTSYNGGKDAVVVMQVSCSNQECTILCLTSGSDEWLLS